ncbi:acetamidase/formamidase family protein [Natranaerobius thermophilus]|uniref:Acetamidase/Formamidase n=1 Tax=Natranaerobius thermophilus (strain ATCC BAA-1301 / DSM 18059 / JW/NM-WN-LF) TaxID=457570 RepID=B2A6V0_NATTJ|nr:acetamidase/formamidase family protein [Natranaerobius thermophilus]ACB84231.1 Acetamidase/Formamidase [Natranaerobius thermophilus JW/NM-WN-LF]
MNFISKQDVVYELSGANQSIAEIEPGQRVTFDTYDCFSDQIRSTKDKFTTIGWEMINPATGPISIKGAQPGDVLKIKIEDISVADYGVMVTAPGFGTIEDEITKETTKIIPIKDNKAIFNDNIEIPIKPMIGVIGTAPEGDQAIPCGTPGEHGGNMDCQEVIAGSTIYLPVHHQGGLLALGDLHAVMADGEVSMTGLEVAGKVTLQIEVLSGQSAKLPLPMIINNENLIVVHSEKTLDESVKQVTSKTTHFIREYSDLELEDAVSLLSLVGDVKICQVVDPLMTVRMEIAHKYLKQLGISEQLFS